MQRRKGKKEGLAAVVAHNEITIAQVETLFGERVVEARRVEKCGIAGKRGR